MLLKQVFKMRATRRSICGATLVLGAMSLASSFHAASRGDIDGLVMAASAGIFVAAIGILGLYRYRQP